MPADALGRRVSCEGELGTVRYVGEVPPTAGQWLGVEWDNAERGKHDGSHDGVQYFTCRHPSGGSFVRPQKASFGVDFVGAVRGLYHPGPVDQIKTFMPNVTSLDLCGNLLSSWEDMVQITHNMEHLREMLLSFNRLSLTSDPRSLSHAFSSLTVLSLTSCQLTWTQLLQCAPMWPRLEELYVSENDITQLSRPLDVLQDLRVLDLSSNPLVQDSILSLAHLTRQQQVEEVEAPDRREGAMPADALGRRVSCEGELGTVRYVGEVPPTAGQWLGVEWDNAERGKHDGSHDGVQYFTCRHPSGGSFVRPQKASFGVDFVGAVRGLYQFDIQEAFTQQIISSKAVEITGFNRNRLDSLEVVSLRRAEVSSPGPVDQIKTFMPNVTSLDLCGNLLSSWEDMVQITHNMEHLREMLLSFNRLSLTSDPRSLSHAFSSLTVLSLTSCQLTWTQLLQCAPMWPRLEELYVSENDITQLSRPLDVLQDLRVLDLSSNPLVQDSILSLAHLTRLENLNLSSTSLSVLEFPDLANDLTPQTTSQIITAKLGCLAVLNKNLVQPEDRRGAELDYIKMFGEEWLKCGGQSDASAQFSRMHPRYRTLINKYGAPEEGEFKKQKPFALKNQLISVRIVCPQEEGRPSTLKKLPDSMTVQKVKGLLSRMLKIPGAAITLAYTGPK
ncbi:hypothetical protein CRUP_021231, partial [Coryphaenoides rupestris]